MDEIKTLYAAYIEEFEELECRRKPWEGALGFGAGAAGYACHDKFFEDAEMLLNSSAKSATPEQALEILEFVFFTAPERWKDYAPVYWVMIALHGKTSSLICCLEPVTAQTLNEKYTAIYPRNLRLPVQRDVIKDLKRRYKG